MGTAEVVCAAGTLRNSFVREEAIVSKAAASKALVSKAAVPHASAAQCEARPASVIAMLPLSAALLTCFCAPGHGATIVVDNATAGSVEGHCTINDAVTAVNTQAVVNGCVAGDG